MWMVLCGLALAGKWDGADSDVVVERDIPKAQEALFEMFQDFPAMSKVFPSDCVQDWGYGVPSRGVGATSRLTYHVGPMRRRLTARVTKAQPSYHVEWDHDGKKGFITQFVLSEGPRGTTHVKLGTYVAPPPWPFKPLYFNKVRPEWIDCYERAMDNLTR